MRVTSSRHPIEMQLPTTMVVRCDAFSGFSRKLLSRQQDFPSLHAYCERIPVPTRLQIGVLFHLQRRRAEEVHRFLRDTPPR